MIQWAAFVLIGAAFALLCVWAYFERQRRAAVRDPLHFWPPTASGRYARLACRAYVAALALALTAFVLLAGAR